ncbi:hypothetical protein [Pseudoruegeria aquimaris]|uniref:hypothetical protein n=1 Tax=Pseudoruegeria aquimaris TaxID=393663 RepID=UPI001594C6EF|nr:hypothetical protein [Pseudoruegeria aquimaris]
MRYWANFVEIALEASVLEDPRWCAHLPKAFSAISHQLGPFYGEARLLRGYEISRRGALLIRTQGVPDTPDGMSERSPVSPWWTGVPPEPAIACVIGAPYAEHWPGRKGRADRRALSFCQPAAWGRDGAGYAVPEDLAQRPAGNSGAHTLQEALAQQNAPPSLPPVFPF